MLQIFQSVLSPVSKRAYLNVFHVKSTQTKVSFLHFLPPFDYEQWKLFKWRETRQRGVFVRLSVVKILEKRNPLNEKVLH